MDNLLLRKKDKSNDIFDWNSYYFKSLCINCFLKSLNVCTIQIMLGIHNSVSSLICSLNHILCHSLGIFQHLNLVMYILWDFIQMMILLRLWIILHRDQCLITKKTFLIFRRKSYISLNHCSLLYIVYIIKFVDICIKN